jgi:rhodanese-related sulfurtransferase
VSELARVSRETLWQKLESGEELVLVDALPPMTFAMSHLPGAVNIPPEGCERWAARRIPEKTTQVVVYCQNPDCESSVEVASRLLELGYENVSHYAGGKSDWVAGGLPLEGARGSR